MLPVRENVAELLAKGFGQRPHFLAQITDKATARERMAFHRSFRIDREGIERARARPIWRSPSLPQWYVPAPEADTSIRSTW